jgi:hypothetical protein
MSEPQQPDTTKVTAASLLWRAAGLLNALIRVQAVDDGHFAAVTELHDAISAALNDDGLEIADGIQYDPAANHLIVSGVRWSPELMANFSGANGDTGAWRGPFWIRRDTDHIVVTNADPAERGRDC